VNVLVDTSVWSIAFRRTKPSEAESGMVSELRELVREGRARVIGPIRQELLSGVADSSKFERLREALSAFPDEPIDTRDYERAAEFANRCRSRGVQGSSVDMLICAVAFGRRQAIYTADKDFDRYAPILELTLHEPRS
jgi:predicted nucleic acid-binding protein